MNEHNTIAVGYRGFQLTTIDEAWRFAKCVIEAGLAPKGMTNPATVMIATQTGLELGFTPMQALSSITVINGRPAPSGAAGLALLQNSGVLSDRGISIRFVVGDRDATPDEVNSFPDALACEIRSRRASMVADQVTAFSVGDAKRAGLWGKKTRNGDPTPWITYPKQMLKWRAVGFHLNEFYPDILKGLKIAEELRDYPVEAAVSTARAEPAPSLPAPREPVFVPDPGEEVPASCDGSDSDDDQTIDAPEDPARGLNGAERSHLWNACKHRASQFEDGQKVTAEAVLRGVLKSHSMANSDAIALSELPKVLLSVQNWKPAA